MAPQTVAWIGQTATDAAEERALRRYLGRRTRRSVAWWLALLAFDLLCWAVAIALVVRWVRA